MRNLVKVLVIVASLVLLGILGGCGTTDTTVQPANDNPFAAAEAPLALRELLARASDMPDFDTLEAMLKETLAAVREAFDRIVA